MAASFLPFMIGKHTATREELMSSMTLAFDRQARDAKAGILQYAAEFILTGKTIINGMTFIKGVNDASFVDKLQTL